MENQNLDKELQFFTLRELEQILHLSRRTLQSYVSSGKLKAVKNGNKWIVSRKNLEDYLNGASGE